MPWRASGAARHTAGPNSSPANSTVIASCARSSTCRRPARTSRSAVTTSSRRRWSTRPCTLAVARRPTADRCRPRPNWRPLRRGLPFRYFFEERLRGTLPPAARASLRPIAIACLRLVTFLPERPDLSSPRFISCIARLTFLPAFGPYLRRDFLRPPVFFRELLFFRDVLFLREVLFLCEPLLRVLVFFRLRVGITSYPFRPNPVKR